MSMLLSSSRPSRPKPQWGLALRHLRALLRNPQATENVFALTQALEPDRAARGVDTLLAFPQGRRLFFRRPSLLAALADREALARLPGASLGRAYLDHMDRWGLSTAKLVEMLPARPAADDDLGLRWHSERRVLCHDLWHVLTGHGADPLGETTLLWFGYGLEGGRATALLMIGATLRSLRRHGLRLVPRFWKALRQGRKARGLLALPFEELLACPLAEVRAMAGLSEC
jgi:ubiquinone biosynthesis protein COQ4